MRYLLLSDLHSNLEATLAVMDSARARRFDRAVVLGDLVGYGASPNEVVRIIRELEPVAVIRGNHDKVASGVEGGEDFNQVAREAALQNRRILSPEHRDYLMTLPRGPLSVEGLFMIAHGTPLDEDEYLVQESDASHIFETAQFSVCFFGHTHLPGAFSLIGGQVSTRVARRDDSTLSLEAGGRYLVNPGSVGQPRDENPKASFGLYDETSQRISIHRVTYPVREAQERIIAAGLPSILADRLERGI